MIILDLTKFKGIPHPDWPKSMPKKIRLQKGKYQLEYDLHPMVRKTKWYKELLNNCFKNFPDKNPNLPIGINSWNFPGMGEKIIKS